MAYKTKPDTAGLAQLKKDLAQGKPGRLYVFHGEETYLRDHYLGKLREVLLSGGMGEFNLHRLRPADVNPRALEEAVDCLPMMAERTMVLVTDFDLFKAGERDREEYIRTLSQLPEYCCLVFVYDLLEYKPDARTKLAAALKLPENLVPSLVLALGKPDEEITLLELEKGGDSKYFRKDGQHFVPKRRLKDIVLGDE